ncbi:right-handed parallel beta-helix repeat-containing protein [Lentisphaera marina]|uniref:right-handed parallel beta-helix repeat-containing protein n=1 Tax=Lentisphaera marina TaxID=1111041 RepID=UPI0023658341|nr:right-handed parallel beta-helix repeat-containing protein [Lentisphaera marina]MDD7985481.1 right-handed parallel beta-helix repeat-containing protein [Lentisphaera marina]
MKIIQSLSLCLVVLCYFSTHAISASKGPLDQAKTYYVAQTGKDSNEGSQRSPFQSIQQAAKIAKAGDTVLIGQGVYREILSPRNSGIESKPISFKALGDGEVVISGNQILQNWQPLSDGSWKTKMDWDLGNENQLFCQGKMMILARWPNDRDGKLMTADGAQIEEGSTNTQIKNQSFPDQFNSKDLKGATLWSVAGSRWSAWTRVVTGYNQKEKAIAIPELKGFWFGEIHSPASKKGGEFYISGKRALLDSPGEWYYDRKAQEIYFMPPRGKDPNQLKIETKKRLYGIDFHNKKHINFEGIKLFATAVRTQNIEHCHFSKITLLHPTHTAYIKSMFYPISGITLSGRHNSISNSELSYSLDGGIKVQGDDNQVVNCYIHDFNYFGANGRGIELNGDRNLISHNTLSRAGRSSMKLAGQENLIQHNDISHMGLMTHDTGCIHLGGQDGQNTIIRYNILRDTGGEENNTNAMYFDNFCQNFIVHDNISWNVPTSLRLNRPSNNIMIFNNTFAGMINNLYGPWERQRDQWGTMLVNNVALKETKRRGHSTEILVKEEVPLVSNYKNHKATIGDFLNTETLQLVK